jgi:hypothetical protein
MKQKNNTNIIKNHINDITLELSTHIIAIPLHVPELHEIFMILRMEK